MSIEREKTLTRTKEDSTMPRDLPARAKLIAAARIVMGRDGVETSSIPTIVDAAGVGVGSFYKHFGSKEALARAVFQEQTVALHEELNTISRATEDMPRAMAYGTRRCLQLADEDPVWGWFIVHSGSAFGDLSRLMEDLTLHGLVRGKALSSLAVSDTAATMILIQASVTALLKARLTGALSEDRAHGAVENILRLAGADGGLAREIATEPMDELRCKLSGRMVSMPTQNDEAEVSSAKLAEYLNRYSD